MIEGLKFTQELLPQSVRENGEDFVIGRQFAREITPLICMYVIISYLENKNAVNDTFDLDKDLYRSLALVAKWSYKCYRNNNNKKELIS